MKTLKLLFKMGMSLKLILLIAAIDSSVFAQGQSSGAADRATQARERVEQARQDTNINVDTLRQRNERRAASDTVRNRGEMMRGQAAGQDERGREISEEARRDGRAFGQRMAEQAREHRAEKARELQQAESEGRTKAEATRERIENARANLQNARNEGRVSESEFTERMNRIERAEQKLGELEEKLNRGQQMRRAAMESMPQESNNPAE